MQVLIVGNKHTEELEALRWLFLEIRMDGLIWVDRISEWADEDAIMALQKNPFEMDYSLIEQRICSIPHSKLQGKKKLRRRGQRQKERRW